MEKNHPTPDEPLPEQRPADDLRDVFLPGADSENSQLLGPKPPLLSPGRIWTIAVLLLALGLGWLCFFGPLAEPLEHAITTRLAANLPTATPTSTQTPTATELPPTSTPTLKPTRTPRPVTETPTLVPATDTPPPPEESPTPTSAVSGCIPASQVTLADVGKTMCVTGSVLRISEKPSSFSIFVEDPKDAFYFVSYDRTWPDLKENSCIFATGEIFQLGITPIMLLSYTVPLQYCP